MCDGGWQEFHPDEGKFTYRQVLCYGETRHPEVKEFSVPTFSWLDRTSQKSNERQKIILKGHLVIRALRLDFEQISSSPLMASVA
jgi:hypothetical protein